MLAALSLIPIMAAVGLAIDGGNMLAQRRAAQNGADAGALAGLADLARSLGTPPASPNFNTDITSNATANAGASSGSTVVSTSWSFIDNAGAAVSQASATGVKVMVTKTFPTFFVKLVPGFSTLTVNAQATANLQVLTGGTNPPIVVCADGLMQDLTFFPGGLLDYSHTPPSIRPEVIFNLTATPPAPTPTAPIFVVHGSKVGQSDGGCGWAGSSFKGDDGDLDCDPEVPCWMQYQPGDHAGPIRATIAGLPNCHDSAEVQAGNCFTVLPIMVNANDPTHGNDCTRDGAPPTRNVCVVTWGVFQLLPGGSPPSGCTAANCTKAHLVGTAIVSGGTGTEFHPGDNGPLIVRLSS
ncbi:MAG TPA: pilus assembly protein TadG-related protein [Chloroflexota bacterium]|nr:pilus assembly protein TadG-related protein [Chloroflexota bacterium]